MTPELTVLLNAIRPHTAEKPHQPQTPADLDWSLLRRLAVTYEVFPLVNRYLKTRHPQADLLPKAEQAEWRKQAQVYAMQSLVTARQLLAMIDLLGQQGIPIIPFKGPVLARQAYGDVAMRQFTDLDFFVAPEDYLAVYHVLGDAGFKPPDKGMERMVGLWSKLGRDLVLRNSRVVLDIHPRLIQGPSFFAIPQEIWKRTRHIQLLDRPVNALSPEDTLIVLALHSARNNWTSLKAITDIAHLLSNHSQWDGPYIIRRMKRFGSLKILDTALRIVRQLFDAPIPIDISSAPITGALFNALAPDNKEEDDHAAILSIMLRSLDSPLKKLRYLCYFLFTPTSEDLRVITLPQSLNAVYRLIRPFRLGWRLLKCKKRE